MQRHVLKCAITLVTDDSLSLILPSRLVVLLKTPATNVKVMASVTNHAAYVLTTQRAMDFYKVIRNIISLCIN